MKLLENLSLKNLLARIEKEMNAITNGNFGSVVSVIAPCFLEPEELYGALTQELTLVLGLYDEESGAPYSQEWSFFWNCEKGGFDIAQPNSERHYVDMEEK